MAFFLAVRHGSCTGDAIRVVQYIQLRNEFKFDRKRFASVEDAIENHYTVLFDLCSSNFSKWLEKAQSGSIEKGRANLSNSREAIKRNRDEAKSDEPTSADRNNNRSFHNGRNQKKWRKEATPFRK